MKIFTCFPVLILGCPVSSYQTCWTDISNEWIPYLGLQSSSLFLPCSESSTVPSVPCHTGLSSPTQALSHWMRWEQEGQHLGFLLMSVPLWAFQETPSYVNQFILLTLLQYLLVTSQNQVLYSFSNRTACINHASQVWAPWGHTSSPCKTLTRIAVDCQWLWSRAVITGLVAIKLHDSGLDMMLWAQQPTKN